MLMSLSGLTDATSNVSFPADGAACPSNRTTGVPIAIDATSTTLAVMSRRTPHLAQSVECSAARMRFFRLWITRGPGGAGTVQSSPKSLGHLPLMAELFVHMRCGKAVEIRVLSARSARLFTLFSDLHHVCTVELPGRSTGN